MTTQATATGGRTRLLNVSGIDIPISQNAADALFAKKLVYDCGDGHDLHLDPDYENWDIDEIGLLALAVADALPGDHAR